MIGTPSRLSRWSTRENAADVSPTVSISNHRPGINPRRRTAAAVAASPSGNRPALGTQSPWPLFQSPRSVLYQPASMTRYRTGVPASRSARPTTRSCRGSPQVVHHSLNTTGRSCSTAGWRSTAAAPWAVSRSQASSSVPATHVTVAVGIAIDSPAATVLVQWPNSRSASPPLRPKSSCRRATSICHDPAHASRAAQVTPAAVSSAATNGNHPRTGIVPSWPNRSLNRPAPLQLRSRCSCSSVCVCSRPSALHADRKRWTRSRPAASAGSNGVMPPRAKLLSISSVTGRREPFVNVVVTSPTPSRHASRCAIRRSSSLVRRVTIASAWRSWPASRNRSIDGASRIVRPWANAPG